VQNDEIVFDTGISGSAVAINPYSRYKAPVFDPLASSEGLTVTVGLDELSLADIGTGGANDGDPAYTRVRGAYVEVRGANDCSGLRSVATGRTLTSFTRSVTITDNAFASVLGYPGVMSVGANQMIVRVADQAGNFADFQQTLTYDPDKPVLAASAPDSLTATSNPAATVLARLSVRGVSVSDAYPGRGFWGVWVANSRTPVANPATDTTLRWSPIPAPGTSSEFAVEWSLAAGLPASQVTAGTYYVYMRFLDGAGNATDGVISTTLEISQLTRPRLVLPVANR
ncbi:MAG TPA: exo-alpha-sialidase, partial [Chloroflexaceae bacterium]|nr:exo-alpha-sialidase [Chloroflexaceae bacterium]